MGALELCLVAVGLAMDAFAMALCKGSALGGATAKNALTIGLWFGGFQALMPLLGFLLGTQFGAHVAALDHWIAVLLLAVIGIKMLWDSLGETQDEDASLHVLLLLGMALATSMDAFAVGISFSVLPGLSIIMAVGIIFAVTLALSTVGALLGGALGLRFGAWAERLGGVMLLAMALKLLFAHTNLLY